MGKRRIILSTALVHNNKTKRPAEHPRAASFSRLSPELRVFVDATLELRIDAFSIRYRESDVAAEHAAFVVLAYREDFVLRPTVLANEATEVAETLTATKLPERLFTEE